MAYSFCFPAPVRFSWEKWIFHKMHSSGGYNRFQFVQWSYQFLCSCEQDLDVTEDIQDICNNDSKNKSYFSIKNICKQKFLGTVQHLCCSSKYPKKKNPIENGTRIPQNSKLNSGFNFMLSGLIRCAPYVVLIRYWAGTFLGKTKVPCICTLNDFHF